MMIAASGFSVALKEPCFGTLQEVHIIKGTKPLGGKSV